jgi:hypothetical protein
LSDVAESYDGRFSRCKIKTLCGINQTPVPESNF